MEDAPRTDDTMGAEEAARATKSRELVSLRLQMRGMQRLVVIMGIASAAAISLSAFAAFRSNVNVSELRLVSPGGATRAMLNFEDGYPQLVFYDHQGVKRALFDEAGLLLWGDDGTTMLRELGDASRLEFKREYEEGMETQTWLVNDGVRQQFFLKNKATEEEVRLSLDAKNGARLQIIDKKNGSFVVPERKKE